MKYSVIVPVYKNEAFIPALIKVLTEMNEKLHKKLEVVFVIDGSPDQSYTLLRSALEDLPFCAQLLVHSRNFGSFPAIRSGLMAAQGEYYAIMAADLQEPPALLLNFFDALEKDECDVAIGTRSSRQDPFLSRLTSAIFWSFYQKFVVPEMPKGGVDMFGCNRQFRDQLLALEESRSSLIALIFWLGFRRKLVAYERQPRLTGKSAWTLSKKIEYMMDNIFAFTDYPIRLLTRIGAVGTVFSILLGIAVLIARLSGRIAVPGYTAIIITVLLLGALNLFGLGLVGTYAWRGYENSKRRPLTIVAAQYSNQRIEK